MKRVENITVDVKKCEYDEIKLKQMDTTQITFKMLDNSKEMDLTGMQARIIFTKPNQTIIIQNATVNEDKKSITADLKEDCIRSYGKGKIEVEILKDDEVLSSFYLNVQIEKTSKGNMNSDNTPNYFEQLEDSLNNFKKESSNLLNGIEIAEEKREIAETAREDYIVDLKKRVDKGEFKGESYDDTEIRKIISNEETHKYRLDITQNTTVGAEITLPFYYKVGADVLDVYYVGQRLIKCSTYDDLNTGHYSEVGEADSISNKIKITSDWKASKGNYFDFVVRGEYNET